MKKGKLPFCVALEYSTMKRSDFWRSYKHWMERERGCFFAHPAVR